MSGTLTQAPKRSTSHRAASPTTASSDHLIHIPHAPRGTTPNILRWAAAAIGALALIAAAVMTGTAADARSKISEVGANDAPSVKAADDFLFQLQDMDAQLLNGLLVNGDPHAHVPRAKSESLYEQDRKAADGDLEAATAALAGDQDALNQLHTVTDLFGQYQAQATRTLAEDERAGGDQAGVETGLVIADYNAAHEILFGSDDNGGLMWAATGLEARSAAAIDSSASAADGSLTGVIVGFVLFGLVLLAGLGALQYFLFRRTHRVVNPALVAASVVALVLTIGGASAAGSAADDFHTAKSDAFDSVLALSQAKATGSGANADESRWLLTHDQGGDPARFEASFLAGSQKVAGIAVTDVIDYDNAVASEAGSLNPESLALTRLSPASSFGREFRNITFPHEADKAYQAFQLYGSYLQDDKALREMPLTTPQDRRAAVDYDTDADMPGTSDQAFTAYSKALDDVIAINQDQFDTAMPAARDGIGTWTWLPYLLALLVIGLTLLGLRPRLAEYR